MAQAWYLNPWIVRAVAAVFLVATLAQDIAWAQGRSATPLVLAQIESVDAPCDLTGQWRSSLGVMDLAASPPPRQGVLRGTDSASNEVRRVVAGTFVGQQGEGRIDGVVVDGRLELRWYRPDSFSPPADAGDGFFDIAADCNSLSGAYRFGFDGEYSESWQARRVLMSLGIDSLAEPEQVALQQARGAARQRLAAIEALRGGLDRERFDVARKAAALGSDVGALFGFVRDHIAYDAYAGVLRGARGTLMAGSGSAADQSVLLAALLGAHGHTVRFAEAELPVDVAARLVDGMGALAPRAVMAESERQQLEAGVLADFGLDPQAFAAQSERRMVARQALLDAVVAESARHGQIIGDALSAADLTVAGDAAAARQARLAAARGHVWLQVQEGETWVDLDPSLPGSAVGSRMAEPVVHRALPEDLFHTVAIIVSIERKDGEALESVEVGGWQMRVADVMDAGLPAFWIMTAPADATPPSNASQDTQGFIEQVLAVQGERMSTVSAFRPVLVSSDGEIDIGSAFDLGGRVLPDDAQTRLAMEASDSLEEGLGGVTDIIGGLITGPDEAASEGGPMLSAAWVEYRISGPGFETLSHKRTILDHIGLAARAAGDTEAQRDDDATRAALASIYEVLVSGGPVDEDFAIDKMLSMFLANRPMLSALVDSQNGLPALDNATLASTASYPNRLLTYLLLQQEAARGAAGDQRAYQGIAGIVVGQQEFARDEAGADTFRRGIDIVEAAMSINGDAVAFQRRYGTAIASLERQILDWMMAVECADCERAGAAGATNIVAAALDQGIPLLALGPGDSQALAGAALTPDVRQRIAETIAAGYVVVAPSRAPRLNDRETMAWWRIDPASGATMGVHESGTGGVMEYVDVVMAMAIVFWPALFGFMGGFVGCTTINSSQGGAGLAACGLCGLITGICLELAYLAGPLGLIAATTTCGFGAGLGGVTVCAVAANMP